METNALITGIPIPGSKSHFSHSSLFTFLMTFIKPSECSLWFIWWFSKLTLKIHVIVVLIMTYVLWIWHTTCKALQTIMVFTKIAFWVIQKRRKITNRVASALSLRYVYLKCKFCPIKELPSFKSNYHLIWLEICVKHLQMRVSVKNILAS